MADELTIDIDDEIGVWGITARSVRSAIGDHTGPLTVRINSEGGDVFEGKAIYEHLRSHNWPVTTVVTSLAASISSLIALAGERIQIAEGALMMIHKPWTALVGDARDLRKRADVLDTVEDQVLKHYQARATVPRKTLKQWLAEETWLDAQAALDAGLVDEILPLPTGEARATPGRWEKMPAAVKLDPDYVARKTENWAVCAISCMVGHVSEMDAQARQTRIQAQNQELLTHLESFG